MTIDINDGQIRVFYLTGENLLKCFFFENNKQTGWCLWSKKDSFWSVVHTSRGKGTSVAKPKFGDILDDVYATLLIEMELGS